MQAAPMARFDATPRARSGGEVVCDVLAAHGVRTIFGHAGGAILHFYDALHRHPELRHIVVRHEQAAAHAAAGWARATGRPGVCVATSGPGATNLLTGIMDAHLDSTPMVVLGGQVPTDLIGYDAFQEADLMSMSAAVTKHSFQPREIGELEGMLHAAFHIAGTGRPGPVYVDLPKDVLMATTTRRHGRPLPLPGYLPPATPDPADIERATAILRAAEQPVLLLGGGALIADAGDALLTLAERLAMPIVTTITAKGVVPESHPLVHGMIGMYGRKSGVWLLGEADVVLAMGCRFTDRITGKPERFLPDTRLIHIDVDAYELGKNVPAAVSVRADARSAAAALLTATRGDRPSAARRRWTLRANAAREVCERCIPFAAPSGVHPKLVMDALNELKRPHDIVTTGVGQHQMFACHFLRHEQPRTFITSAGAGTMGFGLPAAMGAAVAHPDAHVFVVDGDGSFQMTLQELATVAEEHLAITIVVLDNGQLGMVRQWQDRVYDGRHESVRLDGRGGHPDFVALAAAYGIPAWSVEHPDDLQPALAAAAATSGPSLVRVAIDARIDNAPMMPAGTSYDEYDGGCVTAPGRLFTDDDAARIEEAGHDD